ncbi:MAG: Kef family K(+) transporter [Alphaproteobacteria bacterium]|nr:Kef family K(+) transporter [Alphaproteobacteria bacterium]
MPHYTPLITTIVTGIVLAFALGAAANRLRISPLVGYLLAGVLAGPHTPGFVADQSLADQLAEIGVILLMFGVGMHFSLSDLLSVKAIAIPGAVVQIGVATAMGVGLSHLLGWKLGAGFVFGLALSVASTVVLLRALQERRLIETEEGRIAVGWLIVEDLAMVLTLVLLPAAAMLLEGAPGSFVLQDVLATLGVTLGKVAAFVVLMLVVGRRVVPWVLHYIAHTGSRELFRLAVLAIGLGIAYGAATLFGVSFALGAFFAGMVLAESELSHRAAEESLPLRDAFAVLFFVSVGMLFDPWIMLTQPLALLATLAIVLFGKSLAAFLIVRMFKHPTGTALTISASLAQIGEFSFILAALGVDLKLLPPEGRDLILAGAILSIFVNPLFFAALDYFRHRVATVSAGAARAAGAGQIPLTTLKAHAVIIGHGRVGGLVAQGLRAANLPVLVIEDHDQRAAAAREAEFQVIHANGARPDSLVAANLGEARWLIIAIPNAFEAGQIVQQARAIGPDLAIIARAHFDAEIDHLRSLGATTIIMGEQELARGMLDHALGRRAPLGSSPAPAAQPAC